MPHYLSTDSFKMAECIRVGKPLFFNQDVLRSFNINCYSSDYQGTKEIT